MKRVLIIEDHPSAELAIKSVLREVFQFNVEFVCFSVFNKSKLTKLLIRENFDLAIHDLYLGGVKNFGGISLCTEHQVPSIVYSANTPKCVIESAINSGALGYVVKSSSMKELERVVVSVLNHPKQAPYYCFTAQNIIESDSGLEVNYEVPPIITFRQETVLNYIRSGLKSVEIAERMNLSIDAVNKHRQNMMVKNNCSMAELIERYSFWSHKL